MCTVWMAGFEPATASVQGTHANQATPHPDTAHILEEAVGFEPTGRPVRTTGSLAKSCNRPLYHASIGRRGTN